MSHLSTQLGPSVNHSSTYKEPDERTIASSCFTYRSHYHVVRLFLFSTLKCCHLVVASTAVGGKFQDPTATGEASTRSAFASLVATAWSRGLWYLPTILIQSTQHARLWDHPEVHDSGSIPVVPAIRLRDEHQQTLP